MAKQVIFKQVDPTRLESLITNVYAHAAFPASDATRLANALVDADLRGVHTHGSRFVPIYLQSLRQGSIKARPEVLTFRDNGVTVSMDADNGEGHVVAYKATELAIERAREYGICTITVRRIGHVGALAYYSQAAADASCIGFSATNGGVAMIPPGGREKICGLNPLSWAVPTKRPWSVNLDMAATVVAGGKLAIARGRGEKIPLGWAVDPDGNPTTDPVLGLQGGLLPLGGPKGYGISIILDVLVGVLSGGRFGRGLGAPGSGFIIQVIDIERFIPIEEFKARMEELIVQLKGSALAQDSKGIFLPGEIEYNLKVERLAKGIPLDDFTRDGLKAEAEAAGLPYDIELD
jgi:LDH2 family malate/lactate/ureidoglycolate dehydrogenase